MIDLDDLEALAKAATPGPWSISHESDGSARIEGPLLTLPARYCRTEADAAHIAASSPDAVLELIARVRAADALLREAREYVAENSDANRAGYGAFPGGDPRDFDPDPECSTDEEREAHRLACEAWNRGEQEPVEPAHVWVTRAEAEEMLRAGQADSATLGPGLSHVSRKGFGLGSYTYPDPETDDVLARIDAYMIAQARKEET